MNYQNPGQSEPLLPAHQSPAMIPPAPVLAALPARPRRWPLIALIAAVVLVAGGAGAAYYVYIYNPSPDAVVAAAFDKLSAAKSLHSAVVVESTIKIPASFKSEGSALIPGLSGLPDSVTVNITSEGDADNSDPDNLKANNKIDVYLTGADADQAIALRFEQRQADGTGYISFSEIPSFNFLDWSAVKNGWYSYDAGALASDLEARKQSLLSEPDSQALSKGDDVFSDANLKRVLDIAKETKPFKLVKDWGSDKIDGIAMRHYDYAIDAAAARNFVVKYREAIGSPISDSELASFDKDAAPILGSMNIGMWIDKKTGRFSRLQADATIPLGDELSMVASGDEKNSVLPVKAVVNLSRYDEPVTIELPDNAKPVERLWSDARDAVMNAVMGSFGSSLGGETSMDADNDGSSDAQEQMYGTDPNNPDTDGDGLADGDERDLEIGTDPLKHDTNGNGYDDAQEIKNGYNPAAAGQKLSFNLYDDIRGSCQSTNALEMNRFHEPTCTTFGVPKPFAVTGLMGVEDTRVKARDAKRLADIKQIATALEMYYADNEQYPSGIGITIGSAGAKSLCSGGFVPSCSALESYFSSLPTDPGSYAYYYSRTDGGQNYQIDFRIEGSGGSFAAGPHVMTNQGIDQE